MLDMRFGLSDGTLSNSPTAGEKGPISLTCTNLAKSSHNSLGHLDSTHLPTIFDGLGHDLDAVRNDFYSIPFVVFLLSLLTRTFSVTIFHFTHHSWLLFLFIAYSWLLFPRAFLIDFSSVRQ